MSNTENAPTTPQQAVAALQAQALDSIKSGHAATLEAVKKWNEQVTQFSAGFPSAPAPEVPEEVKKAFGEPDEIVDSVYDFAAKLLELNKQFVHQLLEVSAPAKK